MKIYLRLSVILIALFAVWTNNLLSQEYTPDANTVALYHFNETSGDTIHDASAYHRDGIANGTTVVDGKFGKARNFNGNSDFIEIDGISTDPNSNFTFELWVNINSFNHFMTPLNFGRFCSGITGISPAIWIDTNGAAYFYLYNAGEPGQNINLRSKTILTVHEWYHLAGTYDGGTVRLYIDGMLDTSASYSQGSQNLCKTYIGANKSYDEAFFDGSIDEVRISNKAREPWEFNVPIIGDETTVWYVSNGSQGGCCPNFVMNPPAVDYSVGSSYVIDRISAINHDYSQNNHSGYGNVRAYIYDQNHILLTRSLNAIYGEGGGLVTWSFDPVTIPSNFTISLIGDDILQGLANFNFTNMEVYSAKPSIKITSPTGGELWTAGVIHNITWTSVLVSNVKIDYTSDNGITWNAISTNVPASVGHIEWNIPSNAFSECRVRISDLANSGVTDIGGNFSIWKPTRIGQVVTDDYTVWQATNNSQGGCCNNFVMSPSPVVYHTNRSFIIDQITAFNHDHSVNNHDGYGNVRAYIYDQNHLLLSTSLNTIYGEGGGLVTWYFDPLIVPSNFEIALIGDDILQGLANFDFTNTLVYEKPPITITSPNGGENWVVGSQKTILWNAPTIENVKIELSTDGGANYSTVLVASTPASVGSDTCSVPNNISRQCKIRISDASNPSVFDTSDVTFSIIHTPVIIIPGIMGSPLYNDVNDDNHLASEERTWVNIWKSINGSLDELQLADDGETPASSSYHIKVSPVPNDTWTIESELNSDQLPLSKYKGLADHLQNEERYKIDDFGMNHGDLFVFTYDWRRSNVISGDSLYNFIGTVLSRTGAEKVNLIAHSMGGIVARQCIKKYDVDARSKIGKLFFIGTPHYGSPAIQLARLKGDLELSGYWGLANIFYDRGEFIKISRNFPATYQLFPSEYYFSFSPPQAYNHVIVENGSPLSYSETVNFFKDVNLKYRGCEFTDMNDALLDDMVVFQTNLQDVNFTGIEITNIVGYDLNTVSDFEVGRLNHPICAVEFLYPIRENLNVFGDRSVPTRSAEKVNPNWDIGNNYYIGGEWRQNIRLYVGGGIAHGELPSSDTVWTIIQSVLRDEPVSISGLIHRTPPPMYAPTNVTATVSCPVELHAYDLEGRHTGPTSDTTWEVAIPGSQYVSGSLADPTSEKVIILPKDGSYSFVLRSRDTTASFDFRLNDVVDGYILRSASFDSVPIQPNTIALCSLQTVSSKLNLNIDKDGDGTIDTVITPAQFSSLTKEVTVHNSWNLVSLPVRVENCYKNTLFPTATSSAFKFESQYLTEDSIKNGIGYWLKFPLAESIGIIGIPIQAETVLVSEGWNMVGSISEPIATDSIMSDPPGIITSNFFGYSSSYSISDTIYPGKGYWVKVNQGGKLILSSHHSGGLAARIKIQPISELPPPPPSESGGVVSLPKEYALAQAYPNPFNPSTTIKYQLPVDSRVTLKVYNLLGQVVAILSDEIQTAGYKSEEWNAYNVASGVYFYRLDAVCVANPNQSFSKVMKLMLMR